jgi:hypothetical protein
MGLIMTARYTYAPMPWHEFETRLHAEGLSPLAFCKLTMMSVNTVQRWCDNGNVPGYGIALLVALECGDARAAINEESDARRLNYQLMEKVRHD